MPKRKTMIDELIEEEFNERDVYTEKGREDQLDNDEIDAWEAAFMEGYEDEK